MEKTDSGNTATLVKKLMQSKLCYRRIFRIREKPNSNKNNNNNKKENILNQMNACVKLKTKVKRYTTGGI